MGRFPSGLSNGTRHAHNLKNPGPSPSQEPQAWLSKTLQPFILHILSATLQAHISKPFGRGEPGLGACRGSSIKHPAPCFPLPVCIFLLLRQPAYAPSAWMLTPERPCRGLRAMVPRARNFHPRQRMQDQEVAGQPNAQGRRCHARHLVADKPCSVKHIGCGPHCSVLGGRGPHGRPHH